MALLCPQEAKVCLEWIVPVKQGISHEALIDQSVNVSSDLHQSLMNTIFSRLPKLFSDDFTEEAATSDFYSWS